MSLLGAHHWEEHLWPEHPTVADLNPLVKARVESKDLHTEGAQIKRVLSDFKPLPWLCVGVISWLETKLFNAKLFEELVKHPNQVSQSQVSVGYHPLCI